MHEEHLRCAAAALRQVPDDYRKIDAAVVAGQERGHSIHHGMHIGWAWGEDEQGRPFLDFLSEHPHPGMEAARYFLDGSSEPITTPASMRPASPDPVEDAELERQFFDSNRVAYADLRARGLVLEETELLKYESGEVLFGGGWDEVLRDELHKPYWPELLAFVAEERGKHDVYPPASQTFRAFELTPFDRVKVVILGQDPYPNSGEAHGLAFSVAASVRRKPPSLRNIHTVVASDLSETYGRPVSLPDHGSLEGWAEQGVLLLNTALTVRGGTKKDRAVHRRWRSEGHGWNTFTDAVIRAVNCKRDPVVFLLWGNDAKDKATLIDTERHAVITSSHPSPYSARLGFLTGHPFSEANEKLEPSGRTIDWVRTGLDD